MFWVICFCFLSYFLNGISGQCTPDSSIPASWVVILDTYQFEFLIPNPWSTLDIDGNGTNFDNFGRLCTSGGFVCGSNEDNWVFSEHLQYSAANEVYFNLSYNLDSCKVGSCSKPYFTLYTYNRNSTDGAERVRPSNYQYLTGLETTSRFGNRTNGGSFQVGSIARPSGFSGFYFAIRDTGTCGEFKRVLIYYRVCPARVSGLVSFPLVSAPARSSGNTVYSGSCAPNSYAVTSLEAEINAATGSCIERAPGGARCECVAGYRLNNGISCVACPVGQYRAANESHSLCNDCPSNSESRGFNSSICACETGYYRTSQENAATGCTQPPGPVQGLTVDDSIGETYVVISWHNPSLTGGRSDYYYSIERTDLQGGVSSTIKVADNVTQGTRRFNVSGLQPFTAYVISVITHNDVSNQEPNTIAARTRTVVIRTAEGVPGPVTVINLCTAVIWHAPTTPNGNITGYQIEISNAIMTLPSTDFYFLTTNEQQRSNVLARIRAGTRAGWGQWTLFTAICSVTQAQSASSSCPSIGIIVMISIFSFALGGISVGVFIALMLYKLQAQKKDKKGSAQIQKDARQSSADSQVVGECEYEDLTYYAVPANEIHLKENPAYSHSTEHSSL